jgi:hypothetical protein
VEDIRNIPQNFTLVTWVRERNLMTTVVVSGECGRPKKETSYINEVEKNNR